MLTINDISKTIEEYKLEDFWNWWSDGSTQFMEVRFINYKVAKYIGTKFNLPYSIAGVYINNYSDLLKVVSFIRKKQTMWMKFNPCRKIPTKKSMSFSGVDEGIEAIKFFVFDIDRINKNGAADDNEINKIYDFVKLIEEELQNKNITQYCTVFSGNGFQIIIKLDEPILLPFPQYDKEHDIYVPDEKFNNYKLLIKETVGNYFIQKFNTKENRIKYNAEIDKKCFNIGRVGALPFSFNFKFDPPRVRGVFHYGTGINDGLSDSLIQQLDELNLQPKNKQYRVNNNSIPITEKLTYKNLLKNRLIRFLLSKELPGGDRNSNLIFPLKCLIQQSGLDLQDKRIVSLQRMIEKKQLDKFPFNTPPVTATFNAEAVNNYCINNYLPLLYPEFVLSNKPKKRYIDEELLTYKNCINAYIPEDNECKFELPINTQFDNNDELFIVDDEINNISLQQLLYQLHIQYNEKQDILVVYDFIQQLSKYYETSKIKVILKEYIRYYIEK